MIIYPSATCAGGGFSSHHLLQVRTSLAVVVVTPVLCTGVVFFLCHGNKLILEILFLLVNLLVLLCATGKVYTQRLLCSQVPCYC